MNDLPDEEPGLVQHYQIGHLEPMTQEQLQRTARWFHNVFSTDMGKKVLNVLRHQWGVSSSSPPESSWDAQKLAVASCCYGSIAAWIRQCEEGGDEDGGEDQ